MREERSHALFAVLRNFFRSFLSSWNPSAEWCLKEASFVETQPRTPEGRAPRAGNTRRIVFIGLFGAMAAVLMNLHMPVPFAPPFYEMEIADIPVLIGGFSLGPWAAAGIALVKNVIKLVMRPTSTAFVGELSNILTTCALSIPAAVVYRRDKTKRGAVKGLVAGVLSMTVFSVFNNAFVMLPLYAGIYHMPMEALIAMGTAVNASIHDLLSFVLLAVAPFNLFKGSIEALLTFLLYKRIVVLLRLSDPEVAPVGQDR
ncbi:MAG: ECF transporter S component [Clostridiales bacterium]|nr:ECF transporter S component [Clostridiales bacterium]